MSDLPITIQDEIDSMLEDYSGTEFDMVSFASDKNENVDLVQFVFTTAGIEVEELVDEAEVNEDEETFWSRLTDLFSFKKDD